MQGDPVRRPTVPQTSLELHREGGYNAVVGNIVKPQSGLSVFGEIMLWSVLSLTLVALSLSFADWTNRAAKQAAANNPCACCEGDVCTCGPRCNCKGEPK